MRGEAVNARRNSVMTKTKRRKKAICFVDGFNLYHGIKSLQKPHLKWLDIEGLLRSHIEKEFAPESHIIEEIRYYTANVTWRGPDVQNRQRAYVEALQGHSSDCLKSRFGKFKIKAWTCPSCRRKVKRREEKETDVNIAIDMISIAHQNTFDTFCLLSADTDFMPVLEHIRQNFRKIDISLLFPPNRMYPAYEYFEKKLGVRPRQMDTKSLDQYLLPDKVRFRSRTITRPEAYAPPAM